MLTCLFVGWVSFCSGAVLTPIEKIETVNAPLPYGAYSQALSVDLDTTKKLIFVSGQVPFNHVTGKMVEDDIHSATNQTLDNIEAILKGSGSGWEYVVRVEVFLQNLDRDWNGMNEEYAKRFHTKIFPSRHSVGVHLNSDTLVEISCIAVVPRT